MVVRIIVAMLIRINVAVVRRSNKYLRLMIHDGGGNMVVVLDGRRSNVVVVLDGSNIVDHRRSLVVVMVEAQSVSNSVMMVRHIDRLANRMFLYQHGHYDPHHHGHH